MVKITTSDVKKWSILLIDGKLFKVTETAHTHMWRWWANDTYKVKDIVTWKSNVFTYNSGAILEQAEIATQNAVYLYNSGDTYSFMENDTWEIYDIVGYLKDNLDVYLQMYQGNVINVILPSTITYKITSTVPGVKWDRAQAWTKPATIETWMEIQVPLYKEAGDEVVVNTLTGTVN